MKSEYDVSIHNRTQYSPEHVVQDFNRTGYCADLHCLISPEAAPATFRNALLLTFALDQLDARPLCTPRRNPDLTTPHLSPPIFS